MSVFFNKLVSQSLFTTTFLRSYSERFFLLHKKVRFKKKKKSPIPKYSTTNIDRVLSSCGFSY